MVQNIGCISQNGVVTVEIYVHSAKKCDEVVVATITQKSILMIPMIF